MGLVRNKAAILQGLNIWVTRQEEMIVREYRRIVWLTFLRILRNTPQFSGHAVANWYIGVGTPVLEAYSPYGKPFDWEEGEARKKGDSRAIRHVIRREKPKLPQITRRTKVYFTNVAVGDNGMHRKDPDFGMMDPKLHGAPGGGFYYMQALQDPFYWYVKLRDVNKPYEVAYESVLHRQMQPSTFRRTYNNTDMEFDDA